MRDPCPEWLEFLTAFDAAITPLAVAARARVLDAAPEANELVYDAYNAVSVAFSFSERLADGFMHVAAYAKHVNLGFNRGASLDDPLGVLVGTGASIRHVKIRTLADLDAPAITPLVEQAVAQGIERVPTLPSAPRAIVRPTRGARRRPAARS